MSATVSLLVEYVDGKPHTAIGYGYSHKTRSFTRKGSAESYREDVNMLTGPRDIRVLNITIPDEKLPGDTIWPELVPEVAVAWS